MVANIRVKMGVKQNIMRLLLLAMLKLIIIVLPVTKAYSSTETLIVAGGCFWCVESDYEKYKGVLAAESGYINGHVENPTYNQVASKKTGHFEVVKISYDSTKVSLQELTDYFWKTIDPTDAHGQFCDKGTPYKTALFYQTPAQKQVFARSLGDVTKNKPFAMDVVTEILEAETFYLAEDYHQDYYKKNPLRYNYYRTACRRDARIETLWGEVASKKFH
ncbi:MAG: peptide-methionine (S)-S-oxide reductase [Candidatus Endobugula sp.]|jgi:peptide-methionine (S)-S-oxide reductase